MQPAPKNNSIIGFLALVLLLAVGAAFWYVFMRGEQDGLLSYAQGTFVITTPSSIARTDQASESFGSTGNTRERYHHPVRKFSFAKPDGFTVISNTLEGETEIVTVEKDKNTGFQIFITPHDEPMLTAERIMLDLPHLTMENVRTGTLDSVPALIFNSRDNDIGNTYEVWFLSQGYLYQIMTYAYLEDSLNEILGTWKF